MYPDHKSLLQPWNSRQETSDACDRNTATGSGEGLRAFRGSDMLMIGYLICFWNFERALSALEQAPLLAVQSACTLWCSTVWTKRRSYGAQITSFEFGISFSFETVH
eukprot:1185483-Prorocentrum_minimum.AAC.2